MPENIVFCEYFAFSVDVWLWISFIDYFFDITCYNYNINLFSVYTVNYGIYVLTTFWLYFSTVNFSVSRILCYEYMHDTYISMFDLNRRSSIEMYLLLCCVVSG